MSNQDKINRFLNYLESDPDNSALIVSIGDLYHASGQFEDAERFFKQALSLGENRPVALGRLCNVLLSQNRPEEALKGYLELIRIGEDAPQLHHNIALCHLVQYRLDAAFDIFKALVDDSQSGHSAQFYLAVIHQIQGNLEEAFRIASDLVNRNNSAFYQGYLSTVHYARGSTDKAVGLAHKVLEADETNADAHSVLGTRHLELLDTRNASMYFNRITELFPADARGWHGLGMVDLQEGNTQGAIRLLHQASNLLPGNAGMRVSLAWAYYINHDFKTATLEFQSAIDENRNFAESWGGLSCSLLMQGNIQEAEHACETALKLDKSSFGGIFAKSLLLKHKGKDTYSVELLANMLDTPTRPGGDTFTEAVQQYLKLQQISLSPSEITKTPRLH